MKKLILSIIVLSLIVGNIYSQNVEVPLLEKVNTVDDLHLFITISLGYDEDGEVIYGLGELETTEIDSIKPYIKKALKSKPDFYLNRATIEIVADKNISIYDFEMLQEEIKRLGFLKVFYVAKSENFSRISGIWSTGYFFKLPRRDKIRIHKFYDNREIKFREKENLSWEEVERRQKLRKSALSEEEMNLNIPPPPPPPPPPKELPKKFDDSVKEEFKDYEIIVIEIDSKDVFSINDKKISERKEIESIILNSLAKGRCLFVLRKNATATYNDYLFALAAIRNGIYSLREKLSDEKHSISFNNLNFEQRREVVKKYPMIILDEPNYIK